MTQMVVILGLIFGMMLGNCASAGAVVSPVTVLDGEGVERFVTADADLGLSCEDTEKFSEKSIPRLLEMLEDARYEDYWQNIVVTLGCIGDESAVNPLEQFLKKHEGQVSIKTFSALVAVPTALGFIAFRGDERALEVLENLAKDDYWRKAHLNIFGKESSQNAQAQKNLMRSTITALGITGDDKVKVFLKKLRHDPFYGDVYGEDIDEAIQE